MSCKPAVCDMPGCEVELKDWRQCLCPVHWNAMPRDVLREAIILGEQGDVEGMRAVLMGALERIYRAKGTN